MATFSSILAWRIPWTEELGGLQSMGSQRHDWSDLAHWELFNQLEMAGGGTSQWPCLELSHFMSVSHETWKIHESRRTYVNDCSEVHWCLKVTGQLVGILVIAFSLFVGNCAWGGLGGLLTWTVATCLGFEHGLQVQEGLDTAEMKVHVTGAKDPFVTLQMLTPHSPSPPA